jgi:hypothetical protein
METSFVIPVKDDAKRLAGCLDSLPKGLSGVQFETVVVDNGSIDESKDVARRFGAVVVELPEKRVSELRNAGAAKASGTLLAFVDADHKLGPGWLDVAAADMKDQAVGAVGAMCLPPPNGTWVQQMYGHLRGRTTGRQDVGWLGAGNMVVRRTAFEQVGGFDAALEACEDVDLCRRLLGAGWRIVADEKLVNIHLGDPATLRALFRGERWRGRDNLRVSLRGTLTLRDLPSVVTPIVMLAALIAIVLSPASLLFGVSPWPVIAAGTIVVLALTGLRTARMMNRAGVAGLGFIARAFAVAMTYDLARAIALVSRAGHHRRRAAAPALEAASR